MTELIVHCAYSNRGHRALQDEDVSGGGEFAWSQARIKTRRLPASLLLASFLNIYVESTKLLSLCLKAIQGTYVNPQPKCERIESWTCHCCLSCGYVCTLRIEGRERFSMCEDVELCDIFLFWSEWGLQLKLVSNMEILWRYHSSQRFQSLFYLINQKGFKKC